MATTDRAFKSVGDLIKLLPSGTVFLFQFLSPLLTNAGHCATANKFLAGGLLVACGLSCCFSSFTDSFIGSDGRVYYGVVTTTGLWLFSGADVAGGADLSRYKLRLGDFVHASLALLVFSALTLLDDNTAMCFYPGLVLREKTMVMVVPTVVGAIASFVFMLFPNNSPAHFTFANRVGGCRCKSGTTRILYCPMGEWHTRSLRVAGAKRRRRGQLTLGARH